VIAQSFRLDAGGLDDFAERASSGAGGHTLWRGVVAMLCGAAQTENNLTGNARNAKAIFLFFRSYCLAMLSAPLCGLLSASCC
jgi:hypothetical protein